MLAIYADAQNKSVASRTKAVSDSLIREIHGLLKEVATFVENKSNYQAYIHESDRFRLYPTTNIYNFLKLDTKTGMITRIQWDFESKKEYQDPINSEDLSVWGYYGPFELYPTQNMYTFLLLDKRSGRAWHVQWGNSSWIREIK